MTKLELLGNEENEADEGNDGIVRDILNNNHDYQLWCRISRFKLVSKQ